MIEVFAHRLVVSRPPLAHIAEDEVPLPIDKGRLHHGGDVLFGHLRQGAIGGEVSVDDVMAGVGPGDCGGHLDKGVDGHIHGPVTTNVDAHIPIHLLGGPEKAV